MRWSTIVLLHEIGFTHKVRKVQWFDWYSFYLSWKEENQRTLEIIQPLVSSDMKFLVPLPKSESLGCPSDARSSLNSSLEQWEGTIGNYRKQKFLVFSNSKIFKKCFKNQWKIYNFLLILRTFCDFLKILTKF